MANIYLLMLVSLSDCLCNVPGSESSAGGSCNATTGQCTCKANVMGLKCDTCKTGFLNLQASDVDGCERKKAIVW